MSRSKHTIPIRIRAPRRVRAPDETRSHGDASAFQTQVRVLKELGIRIASSTDRPEDEQPAPLPRVRVSRPREGFHHPAGRADIVRLLRLFGETCTYGLQSIELVRGEDPPSGGTLPFGRLVVPGRILLYDQPASPWVLAGRLPDTEVERLRLAGAAVEEAKLQTMVTWTAEALRDFMLFDVLMHEIGHHRVQQYKGKRPEQVLRTREHEALADRFARRCRRIYSESREPQP